jgi:hypothetical protein
LALLAAREICRRGGLLVVLDRRGEFYPPAAVRLGIEPEQFGDPARALDDGQIGIIKRLKQDHFIPGGDEGGAIKGGARAAGSRESDETALSSERKILGWEIYLIIPRPLPSLSAWR